MHRFLKKTSSGQSFSAMDMVLAWEWAYLCAVYLVILGSTYPACLICTDLDLASISVKHATVTTYVEAQSLLTTITYRIGQMCACAESTWWLTEGN